MISNIIQQPRIKIFTLQQGVLQNIFGAIAVLRDATAHITYAGIPRIQILHADIAWLQAVIASISKRIGISPRR
ncbi:MAG: hypothetical protein WBL67_20030 [Nitrososphaeraceae archaeon]